ncbi:MAG: lactonase family protein [Flavipsychrobacter sp.]|nr:lactonase family protein [Flavipsychrobacter sp.]
MCSKYTIRSVIVFFIVFFSSSLIKAQHCYVFVGSYNWDSTKAGIYIYELDTTSGQLVMRSSINNVLNPAYLTLSPNGKYVYACTGAQQKGGGAVSSYAVNIATGVLSFISTQKSGGENPVYLSVHQSGKWLLNANYTGGSISAYLLDTSGTIAPASQTISFKDSSVNKERQDRAHPHSILFSPQQDYVFVPDLGADKIRCFAFESSGTQPLQAAAQPYVTTVAGSGPRHLTFHPNGHFCYCTEEMGGTVTVYTYSAGKLDSIQRVPTRKKQKRKDYSNADIHISPDGMFLYASNRSKENNIAIFSINQQSGKLKWVGTQSTLGNHPRNFAIYPTGKFLLVANQISGDIVVFKRDIKTGMLSVTGTKQKVPGASCLKIKQYF